MLGGGFKYFLFSPRKLGKMNPFWLIFFQMGWFNHQLAWNYVFNWQCINQKKDSDSKILIILDLDGFKKKWFTINGLWFQGGQSVSNVDADLVGNDLHPALIKEASHGAVGWSNLQTTEVASKVVLPQHVSMSVYIQLANSTWILMVCTMKHANQCECVVFFPDLRILLLQVHHILHIILEYFRTCSSLPAVDGWNPTYFMVPWIVDPTIYHEIWDSVVIDLRDSCPRPFRGFKRRCLEVHRPFLEEKRTDIGQNSKKKKGEKNERKIHFTTSSFKKVIFRHLKNKNNCFARFCPSTSVNRFRVCRFVFVAPTSGSQWFGKCTTGVCIFCHVKVFAKIMMWVWKNWCRNLCHQLCWYNHDMLATLPETTMAPENWWLEDYFSFGFWPIFRGELVSGSVYLEIFTSHQWSFTATVTALGRHPALGRGELSLGTRSMVKDGMACQSPLNK